jgi:hypothetical protein
MSEEAPRPKRRAPKPAPRVNRTAEDLQRLCQKELDEDMSGYAHLGLSHGMFAKAKGERG